MNEIILEAIPFEPNVPELMKKLHLKEGSGDAADFLQLFAQMRSIANPKALYKVSTIEERGEDYVIIDGQRFNSRVLAVNLENSHRVFPFVATCGMEMEDLSNRLEDVIQEYWAQAIKEAALYGAISILSKAIHKIMPEAHFSTMSPGSLQDWPIKQQTPLFALLGNASRSIGVTLTDSFLMIPTKSVSGIQFTVDGSFESCELCPRTQCQNRRAPYDETLYEKKYCPGGH